MLQQQHREEAPVYRAAPTVQDSPLDAEAVVITTPHAQSAPLAPSAEVQRSVPQEAEEAVVIAPTTQATQARAPIRLANTTAETVQSWLDYVELKPPRRWGVGSAFVLGALFLPYYQMWEIYSQQSANFRPYWTVYSVMPMLLGSCVPLVLLAKINRLRRESDERQIEGALLETPTVDWIPSLVDALVSSNRRVRAAAERLLPRLLLQVRPHHGELLTPLQWETLGLRLRANAPGSVELNLAMLRLLERVNVDRMLPYIEAAATSSPLTPGTWRVRRAARTCLKVIDARQQAEAEALIQSETALVAGRTTATSGSEEQRTISPELAALLQELEAQRRGQAQPGMRLAFLLAAYGTLLPGSIWKAAEGFAAGEPLSGALWTVAALLTTQLHRLSLLPQHRELMQRLADYDDVAGVGALAETLEWPDPRVQDMAASALKRLLPRLRASDAHLLTRGQRACLYRRLTMSQVGRDGTLILAILAALQQVGDEAAIPHVRRLADGKVLSPTQRKVQAAAQECLPYLETHASQQRASQTLLRASAQEHTPAGDLLRPAESANATVPQELLRPGIVTPQAQVK
jgi:hypothetical protein